MIIYFIHSFLLSLPPFLPYFPYSFFLSVILSFFTSIFFLFLFLPVQQSSEISPDVTYISPCKDVQFHWVQSKQYVSCSTQSLPEILIMFTVFKVAKSETFNKSLCVSPVWSSAVAKRDVTSYEWQDHIYEFTQIMLFDKRRMNVSKTHKVFLV